MPNYELHLSRARLAWPILVERARNGGDCFTYRELSDQIDVHWRAAGWYLGEIQKYCEKKGLPRLQALAVSKGSKVPGGGYHGARGSDQHAAELRAVRQKSDWPEQAPF